ncbi:MAG TPA: tetratricopeptide repeat protein [Bryobacteraceae bacterium]|jgi:predicted Zn-dependent protease|nr:tetratricopeptide repeat protein [Bryobacteraceae bacterium]
MLLLPILLFAAAGSCEQNLGPAITALQQREAAHALEYLQPLRASCAQSSSYYELLGLASELAGQKSEAERALESAVKLDSRSPRLLTELGATLFQNGKPAVAARYLDQSLKIDPANSTTIKYAIGAAVATKDWRRAADLFGPLQLETNSSLLQSEPVLLVWFAQAMVETGRLEQLDSLLSSQRGSLSPGLLFSLGTIFGQHGLYQRAVDTLAQIPVASADSPVFFNLGLAYSHLRRFEQARAAYFQTIDKHPNDVDAYFHVGVDYAASAQPRFAIPWLYRAHSLAPQRADITYALAEQLIGLQYLNSAKQLLSDARTRTAAEPVLLVAEGDLKLAESDPTAAASLFELALRRKPGLPAASAGLARAYTESGKPGLARGVLETALVHDPQDPSINSELGLLEEKQGNWSAALNHLTCAWKQDQANPRTALALAHVYERMNRPSEGLTVLDAIAPMAENSLAYHLELARIYSALDRRSEAKAEQDKVSALQNQSQDALHFDNPGTYIR